MVRHERLELIQRAVARFAICGYFLRKFRGVNRCGFEQQQGELEQPGGSLEVAAAILDCVDREPDGQADTSHIGHSAGRSLAKLDRGMFGRAHALGQIVRAQSSRAGAETPRYLLQVPLYGFGNTQ